MTAADSEPRPAARIAVIGGGIAGLVAALECAKVGLAVTLIEREPVLGGTIRSGEVGGVTVDLGPDGYATTAGHVRKLIDEVGLSHLVSPLSAEPSWVAGLPSGPAALPAEAVLGIPANTWDPAVRRIVGWSGVWRAYLDRLRPPLTIGQEHNLDKLVRRRMGDLVADRLVAPISVGRFGLTPGEIDVDVAAPGLNTALTRTGSLGGAVTQLRGDRLRGDRSPALETLEGGMAQLVTAMRARLSDLSAVEITGVRAERLERRGDSGWRVEFDGDHEPVDVDAVVVAADEAEARRLLAPHIAEAAGPGAARLQDVVTLVVDSAELDAHPRGAAVYPIPGETDIASVEHVTARWPWLAALGAHTHVLRVSFAPRSAADAIAAPRETVPGLVAKATSAASALLGVDLAATAVLGTRHELFAPARPAAARGLLTEAAVLRRAVHDVDGLAVVGAWLSGSGMAQVIPDARGEADRLRRIVLWGADASES